MLIKGILLKLLEVVLALTTVNAQEEDQYGGNFIYPDYTRYKKKRNQYNLLPFEQEIMEVCVTCGCNIF